MKITEYKKSTSLCMSLDIMFYLGSFLLKFSWVDNVEKIALLEVRILTHKISRKSALSENVAKKWSTYPTLFVILTAEVLEN